LHFCWTCACTHVPRATRIHKVWLWSARLLHLQALLVRLARGDAGMELVQVVLQLTLHFLLHCVGWLRLRKQYGRRKTQCASIRGALRVLLGFFVPAFNWHLQRFTSL